MEILAIDNKSTEKACLNSRCSDGKDSLFQKERKYVTDELFQYRARRMHGYCLKQYCRKFRCVNGKKKECAQNSNWQLKKCLQLHAYMIYRIEEMLLASSSQVLNCNCLDKLRGHGRYSASDYIAQSSNQSKYKANL